MAKRKTLTRKMKELDPALAPVSKYAEKMRKKFHNQDSAIASAFQKAQTRPTPETRPRTTTSPFQPKPR